MFKPLQPNFKITSTSKTPTVNVLNRTNRQFLRPLSVDAYQSLIGTVVYNGQHSTRIAPRHRVVYDGRLVRSHFAESLEGAKYPFARDRNNSARVSTIVKGLMMNDPRLITSPVEATFIETAFQLANAELAEWMDNNREELTLLLQTTPLFQVARAVSQMKNHDGDIEAKHNDAWLLWRDRKGSTGPTPPETAASLARRLRNKWVRKASQAKQCVHEANAAKADKRSRLLDAPPLYVYDRDIKGELENTTISGIQTAT